VQARNKKKEGVALHGNEMEMEKVGVKGGGGGDGGGDGGGVGTSTVTNIHPEAALAMPDKMEEKMKASVEKIRFILNKLMKTQSRLRKWMMRCDQTSNGLLGRVDFTQVVLKVVKKVGHVERKEGLMENIWASVKVESATGVGWDVVEHEVMKQWVFPEEVFPEE
jgi:hypothetical protein